MKRQKQELICVNRVYKNSNGGKYSIGKAYELCDPSLKILPEVQNEGVYYRIIPKTSKYHPNNMPSMEQYLTHPLRHTDKQWCLRISEGALSVLGWDRAELLLSLVCIKPDELYLLRKATDDEIISCARRDIDVQSGLILPGFVVAFTKEERDILGLRNGMILQAEINTKTANYIRVRKLRPNEKRYPMFTDGEYYNCFGHNEYPSEVLTKYSARYTSRMSIPQVFARKNGLKVGDKCSIQILDNELLISVPHTCSICGKEYDGLTKLSEEYVCGKCNQHLHTARQRVEESGSINAAERDIKKYLREEIANIEQNISKILNNII